MAEPTYDIDSLNTNPATHVALTPSPAGTVFKPTRAIMLPDVSPALTNVQFQFAGDDTMTVMADGMLKPGVLYPFSIIKCNYASAIYLFW